MIFRRPRTDPAGPRLQRWRDPRRGSALLAVLWLSMALSAIAFALSRSVRIEFDRAAQNVESTRAYFLAQGGIEAAMLHIGLPGRFANNFEPGQRFMRFAFPGGAVEVEIVGENGKLSLRSATPEALARVLIACRIDPAEAAGLAAQIVASRSQGFSDGPSSFSGPGASFLQLEELLRIPGLTPELLYGTYREDRSALVRVGGLQPHMTFEMGGSINVNYASPEVMQAAGLNPDIIQAVEQIRLHRPLKTGDPGMDALAQSDGVIRLGLGGQSTAYTLRATAHLANRATSRSVAAVAKYGASPLFLWDIVRWYGVAQ